MLIDGEKYACDACVRGHRVSNCQHTGKPTPKKEKSNSPLMACLIILGLDRPLTHINKKGRPVSQCTHCRGLRKSRAAHVKCDCGEKTHTKEECMHLERGDPKSELDGDDNIRYLSDQYAVDQHTCCCSHGARCTCALKKDYLDPVPEIDPPEGPLSSISIRKPGLATTRSDNSLTVFTNGHHKPAHKHNDMAHKCGVPYKIPRSHTVHGHSETAQRSVDSLPLGMADGPSPIQDSINSAQLDRRLSKSEHGSPQSKPRSNVDLLNSSLPPLDLPLPTFSNATAQRSMGMNNITGLDGYYSPLEAEQMSFSAGLNMPPVDWSAFDLPLENGNFSTSYSQPPSYASFDHSNLGQPGLTTSSSGEISEVDDYLGGLSPPGMGSNPFASESPETGEADAYRLSTTSSSLGMSQASMLAANNIDYIDIDEFLKGPSTASSASIQPNLEATSHAEIFTRHGITVQDAQNLAHTGVPTEAMGDLTLPVTRDGTDPLWAASFGENVSFDQEVGVAPDAVWTS